MPVAAAGVAGSVFAAGLVVTAGFGVIFATASALLAGCRSRWFYRRRGCLLFQACGDFLFRDHDFHLRQQGIEIKTRLRWLRDLPWPRPGVHRQALPGRPLAGGWQGFLHIDRFVRFGLRLDIDQESDEQANQQAGKHADQRRQRRRVSCGAVALCL